MSKSILSWMVSTALLGFFGPVLAEDGLYLKMDWGVAVAPDMDIAGHDNDWSTKCDRIINPDGLEVTNECDTVPGPSAWTQALGGGTGIRSGLALGYAWGPLRIEGEYFHRTTIYDHLADVNIGDDVTLEKQEQEIELAVGGLDDLQAHNVFANLYYDFAVGSSFAPYVGAGAGLTSASIYYFTHWKRNDDPARIKTFEDEILKAKVAGSTTIGAARLRDRIVGYQVLAGVNCPLGDRVALDVGVRWVDGFEEFESEEMEWNQLRSHESTVGRGEPVLYIVTMDDIHFWGANLSLKYQF